MELKPRSRIKEKWFYGLLLLFTFFAGEGTTLARESPRILVAASIPPIADFARQVGGERVTVITLVPPGASPHTYELKASQVKDVSGAGLLILNGAGLEYWAEKLIEATDNPNLRVVDTSEGISLLDKSTHGGNPHIWLDVRNAMIQVKHIRDGLIRADPDHAAEYEANTSRYLSVLEGLDQEILREVKEWKLKKFIAFHPAWVYFAKRYGLEQAAVIEGSPGREPSPADVVRIVKTAKEIGARAIFAEPQFSPKAAEAIASESGIDVIFLDPLGSSIKGSNYLDLIRFNVAQMANAMK